MGHSRKLEARRIPCYGQKYVGLPALPQRYYHVNITRSQKPNEQKHFWQTYSKPSLHLQSVVPLLLVSTGRCPDRFQLKEFCAPRALAKGSASSGLLWYIHTNILKHHYVNDGQNFKIIAILAWEYAITKSGWPPIGYEGLVVCKINIEAEPYNLHCGIMSFAHVQENADMVLLLVPLHYSYYKRPRNINPRGETLKLETTDSTKHSLGDTKTKNETTNNEP